VWRVLSRGSTHEVRAVETKAPDAERSREQP
jgi:hypothetical protein